MSTIFLPWSWRHQYKVRREVIEKLRMMDQTYSERPPGVAVSTRRLREAASMAADAGVVWSAPLYAMLDDNIARTGRL